MTIVIEGNLPLMRLPSRSEHPAQMIVLLHLGVGTLAKSICQHESEHPNGVIEREQERDTGYTNASSQHWLMRAFVGR